MDVKACTAWACCCGSVHVIRKLSNAATTHQGPHVSEDETESKEEVEDYIDDLGESPLSAHGLQVEDPDYVPCDTDTQQTKKDRRERRVTRSESKGKKKKLGWCKLSMLTFYIYICICELFMNIHQLLFTVLLFTNPN